MDMTSETALTCIGAWLAAGSLLGSIPWGFNRTVYVSNRRPVQLIERHPVTVINPAPVPGNPPAQ